MRSIVLLADVRETERHVGDEAMLQANVARLRALHPTMRIGLVARGSELLCRRMDVDYLLPPPTGGVCDEVLIAALTDADGVWVSGGGNLRSTWPDLLRRCITVLAAAQQLEKPTILTGQTLGPDLKEADRRDLGQVLQRAKLVGLREMPSFALASSLGVKRAQLWHQADDALSLTGASRPARWPNIGESWIALTLDASFGSVAARASLSAIASELALIQGKTATPFLFIPHVGWSTEAPPGATSDADVGTALQALLAAQGCALQVLQSLEPMDVVWATQHASAVISSRYHPIVFASAAGVPALGIHADAYTRTKLQGALVHFDSADWSLSSQAAAEGRLASRFIDLWQQRKHVQRTLEQARPNAEKESIARWARICGELGWAPLDASSNAQASGALLERALTALSLEREANREPRSGAPGVQSRKNTTRSRARSRDPSLLSDEQWADYSRNGYLKLGRLIEPADLEALRKRADDLALGRVVNPAVQMQLDTGGDYDQLGGIVSAFEQGTLLYRKIQGLETDALYRRALLHPLFREICERAYGPHTAISLFRAMVMNKPAGQGTVLPWHQDGGDVWKLDRDPLVTVWVALDAATRANGCVEVVPGSHHLGLLSKHGSTLSAGDAERCCPPSRVEALEVEPGCGLLLHNWLIHRSGVNRTNVPRRAFTACFMDHRTISTLTGARFPLIMSNGGDVTDDHHYRVEWAKDRAALVDHGRRAEEYALSLLAENRKLNDALTPPPPNPPMLS